MKRVDEEVLEMSSLLLDELENLLRERDFTGKELNLAETIAYMQVIRTKMIIAYEKSNGQRKILDQIIRLESIINFARQIQTNHVASM